VVVEIETRKRKHPGEIDAISVRLASQRERQRMMTRKTIPRNP